MPGMSLSVCMCLNWRPSSPAAADVGVAMLGDTCRFVLWVFLKGWTDVGRGRGRGRGGFVLWIERCSAGSSGLWERGGKKGFGGGGLL